MVMWGRAGHARDARIASHLDRMGERNATEHTDHSAHGRVTDESSEVTQVKRRSPAVISDHSLPPLGWPPEHIR
jgi:hypothetical protein